MQRLDKRQVRRSFAAASASYDQLASLQRRVGLELLERFPVAAGPGMDLGCGTGFLTAEILKCQDGDWLAVDIAYPMLSVARHKLAQCASVSYLCADAEALPLATASIGQIYSNLALQWCEDLPGVLTDCHRVLAPGGQLVFATFGPATLHELRSAWQQADDYVHVNDFCGIEFIGDSLRVAGFVDVVIESALYRSRYASVLDLMRELKGIGAHNVSHQRNHAPTTRRQLQAMIRAYPQDDVDRTIEASYEIVWVRAR